jgi:hypothetical protein
MLRLFRRFTDDGECRLVRFGLSEPRESSSSRPLLRSRTSSLESLSGEREAFLRRSWLRSRGRSWSRTTRELMGVRSLPLGSLSLALSVRRGGDRDLLGRVTPRSARPRSRSRRSSPFSQLSFMATYRARKVLWERKGMLTRSGQFAVAELENDSSICGLARSPVLAPAFRLSP